MEKEEIKTLVGLRKYLIDIYADLDKAQLAQTDNKDIAFLIETAVKEVDSILSSHVIIK